PAADVPPAAGQALGSWALRPGVERTNVDRAFADLHGGAGVLVGWHVLGPVPAKTADDLAPRVASALPGWRLTLAAGDGRLRPGPAGGVDSRWLCYAGLHLAEPVKAEFFATGSVAMKLWLNGKSVHARDKPTTGPYPDRIEAMLLKGRNSVVVELAAAKPSAEFSVRFRRKSAAPAHER